MNLKNIPQKNFLSLFGCSLLKRGPSFSSEVSPSQISEANPEGTGAVLV